jgi:hypothetical protein
MIPCSPFIFYYSLTPPLLADAESLTKKLKLADEKENDDDDEEAEAEFKAEQKASDEWDEEMVPVPVDEGLLGDLMEMGFSDVRARKGDICVCYDIFETNAFLLIHNRYLLHAILCRSRTHI